MAQVGRISLPCRKSICLDEVIKTVCDTLFSSVPSADSLFPIFIRFTVFILYGTATDDQTVIEKLAGRIRNLSSFVIEGIVLVIDHFGNR